MELESKYGKIVYRYPKISESYKLLSKAGVKSSSINDADWFNDNGLALIGGMIEHMGFLIESIQINVNGKELKTYNELADEPMMGLDLTKIASELLSAIMAALGGDSEKK